MPLVSCLLYTSMPLPNAGNMSNPLATAQYVLSETEIVDMPQAFLTVRYGCQNQTLDDPRLEGKFVRGGGREEEVYNAAIAMKSHAGERAGSDAGNHIPHSRKTLYKRA